MQVLKIRYFLYFTGESRASHALVDVFDKKVIGILHQQMLHHYSFLFSCGWCLSAGKLSRHHPSPLFYLLRSILLPTFDIPVWRLAMGTCFRFLVNIFRNPFMPAPFALKSLCLYFYNRHLILILLESRENLEQFLL